MEAPMTPVPIHPMRHAPGLTSNAIFDSNRCMNVNLCARDSLRIDAQAHQPAH
jgi:hypothetical protein